MELSTPSVTKTGTLVMIRHGESTYNVDVDAVTGQKGLAMFAGWVNVPLTDKGHEQAREAGRILKQNGFKPDVVYSSTLQRAKETAMDALLEMGYPTKNSIEKTELLERHYGALTGIRKSVAEAEYGTEKFKLYRRSYEVPPPAMDETHPYHPGNPTQGPKVIGMPANAKGSESLEDVVNRVRPFWENELLPRLQKGEHIMIAAHGNSLRALSMIVEGMTSDQIKTYEMKNGQPVTLDIETTPGNPSWEVVRKAVGAGQGIGVAR